MTPDARGAGAPLRPRGAPFLSLLPPLSLVLLLGAAPVTAQGQGGEEGDRRPPTAEIEERRTGIELTVGAGALAPLARLTSDVLFETEVSATAALSGGVTYWLGDRFGLTAQGSWAPADLDVRVSQFTGPIPQGLGDADHVTATAGIVYRFASSGAGAMMEPYLSAGAGLRRLSVDPQASPDVENATDPVATVAGGVYTPVWRDFALRVEIRDVISSYESPLTGESRLQNDILVTVGGVVRP